MLFTTQTFLFFFLPACLLFYYLAYVLEKRGRLAAFFTRCRVTDLVLIAFGAGFYAWACVDDAVRFFVYIVCVYIGGLILARLGKDGYALLLTKDTEEGIRKEKKVGISLLALFLMLALALFVLIRYKYSEPFSKLFHFFLGSAGGGSGLAAPLGISFITFSTVSYLVDIYKGKAKAGNLLDCALYLSFFPKVISGPIVLWRDFDGQSREKVVTLGGVSDGVSRLMLGFAKKLILADTFGALIATATASSIDTPTVLFVSLLYMLQIYFDFSGYSDIAIGISSMLGFCMKENFDFPYLSCSVTEFWRRWHISLGTWFREYVYIPLGGNRKGKWRTVLNILIVFFLTGLWHGVGYAFLLWGLIHGVCNAAEKLLADNTFYQKTPRAVKWILTMLVLFFSWQLFRLGSITETKNWVLLMLGVHKMENIPYTWRYYMDTRMIVLTVVALLGAAIPGFSRVRAAREKIVATPVGYAVTRLLLAALFAVSILFMVNSTYHPFLYFQF